MQSCEPPTHQAAAAPRPPVVKHAVLGTGQPALSGAQRHLLGVAQVILHRLRGPVDGVQHAPAGSVATQSQSRSEKLLKCFLVYLLLLTLKIHPHAELYPLNFPSCIAPFGI